MGFAPRTVKNREEAGTLTYRQSDLAYRAAEVFAHAMRTFGSADKARHWLRLENRTLRDQRPLEVLGSQIGTDAVHEALSRIEHGLGA